MNKLILMGRLTSDPEVRTSQAGQVVAKFSLAVDRRFKREGDPEADFFNLTSFGKQGEFVGNYLKKGIKVLVTARVQNDNYTNKDGVKVYGFQFLCEDIEFAESKKADGGATASTGASAAPAAAPAAASADVPGFEMPQDELPFA